jgi:hypothetical protein
MHPYTVDFHLEVSYRPTYTRGSGPPMEPIAIMLPHDRLGVILDLVDYKGQLRYVVDPSGEYNQALRLGVQPEDILDHVSPRTLEEFERKRATAQVQEEQRKATERVNEKKRKRDQLAKDTAILGIQGASIEDDIEFATLTEDDREREEAVWPSLGGGRKHKRLVNLDGQHKALDDIDSGKERARPAHSPNGSLLHSPPSLSDSFRRMSQNSHQSRLNHGDDITAKHRTAPEPHSPEKQVIQQDYSSQTKIIQRAGTPKVDNTRATVGRRSRPRKALSESPDNDDSTKRSSERKSQPVTTDNTFSPAKPHMKPSGSIFASSVTVRSGSNRKSLQASVLSHAKAKMIAERSLGSSANLSLESFGNGENSPHAKEESGSEDIFPESPHSSASSPSNSIDSASAQLLQIPHRSMLLQDCSRRKTSFDDLQSAHPPSNSVNSHGQNQIRCGSSQSGSEADNKSNIRELVLTPGDPANTQKPSPSHEVAESWVLPRKLTEHDDSHASLNQAEKNEDAEWEVERLLDDRMRTVRGKRIRYYKIDWRGNWPTSWEPESNIDQELIEDYFTMKKKKAISRKKIKNGVKGDTSPRSEPSITYHGGSKKLHLVNGDNGQHSDDDAAKSTIKGRTKHLKHNLPAGSRIALPKNDLPKLTPILGPESRKSYPPILPPSKTGIVPSATSASRAIEGSASSSKSTPSGRETPILPPVSASKRSIMSSTVASVSCAIKPPASSSKSTPSGWKTPILPPVSTFEQSRMAKNNATRMTQVYSQASNLLSSPDRRRLSTEARVTLLMNTVREKRAPYDSPEVDEEDFDDTPVPQPKGLKREPKASQSIMEKYSSMGNYGRKSC